MLPPLDTVPLDRSRSCTFEVALFRENSTHSVHADDKAPRAPTRRAFQGRTTSFTNGSLKGSDTSPRLPPRRAIEKSVSMPVIAASSVQGVLRIALPSALDLGKPATATGKDGGGPVRRFRRRALARMLSDCLVDLVQQTYGYEQRVDPANESERTKPMCRPLRPTRSDSIRLLKQSDSIRHLYGKCDSQRDLLTCARASSFNAVPDHSDDTTPIMPPRRSKVGDKKPNMPHRSNAKDTLSTDDLARLRHTDDDKGSEEQDEPVASFKDCFTWQRVSRGADSIMCDAILNANISAVPLNERVRVRQPRRLSLRAVAV